MRSSPAFPGSSSRSRSRPTSPGTRAHPPARPSGTGAGTARRAERLRRILQCAALGLLLGPALQAGAQDQVLLAEVMPELAGSELGDVPVAPAPSSGATLLVRASDVRRALRRADQTADGLTIPKTTRISRKRVEVSSDAFVAGEREAIEQAASPCSVQDVQGPKQISLTEGPRTTHVELAAGSRRSGRVSGSVVIESGARQLRVPLVLRLLCPEPEIASGKQVNLIIRVGNVRVSTLGEARQSGRVGDVIRVTNRATGASLRGRVLDPQTLEVVP